MFKSELFIRALNQRTNLPAWMHLAASVVLGILAYFVISHAIEQRQIAAELKQIEIDRDKDYIERVEKEKVLLLEAITDVDSPQMICAEDFRIIWSNLKFRQLLDVSKSGLMNANLFDMIPERLAGKLREITQGYEFNDINRKPNEKVSVEGFIYKNGEKVPVLVTFVSVEKSWTKENDGYFIFTVLPSEEQVAFSKSL